MVDLGPKFSTRQFAAFAVAGVEQSRSSGPAVNQVARSSPKESSPKKDLSKKDLPVREKSFPTRETRAIFIK